MNLLTNRKIVITCGTGGVGKTSVSAALGIQAARDGYRTLIITIDPAKRLEQALGLDHHERKLGDEPHDITDLIEAQTGEPCAGRCFALMPATRATFETFIRDISPTPETAERILRNPIFEVFAAEFSGTNEYMAMERLIYAFEKGGFDRIILDTPPSRNTLDFLDAPRTLARFFEERFVRWIAIPQNRFFSFGLKKVLELLERLTGSGFMTHLLDFARAMIEVQTGFSANLARISELLASSKTGFVLVTAPSSRVSQDVRQFVASVRDHGFAFDGVILNRTHGHLKRDVPNPVIERLQDDEKALILALKTEKLSVLATLPQLSRDLHSVRDLTYVAKSL